MLTLFNPYLGLLYVSFSFNLSCNVFTLINNIYNFYAYYHIYTFTYTLIYISWYNLLALRKYWTLYFEGFRNIFCSSSILPLSGSRLDDSKGMFYFWHITVQTPCIPEHLPGKPMTMWQLRTLCFQIMNTNWVNLGLSGISWITKSLLVNHRNLFCKLVQILEKHYLANKFQNHEKWIVSLNPVNTCQEATRETLFSSK